MKTQSPADDYAREVWLRRANLTQTVEELKLIHKSAVNMSLTVARLNVADVLGRAIKLLEAK